ncbi:MAG: peptidase S41 [Bacteroidetes bacterium]|jgi:C-terminal processing protease CtpA/Prc|nr:peptidase S41 [Bacteroidota bacterium]MBP8915551.1 hypothetical protein [Chitinophagales bacterium]
MKTLIFVTIFLLISLSSFPETIPTETEKISTFCKLWGFLKYYHPEVAKGNLDWDSEFMNGVKSINNLKTKQELNNYYSEWIKSLGEVKHCKKCNNILPDSLKFNLELNWLSDTSVFSNNMIEQLQYIQQKRNQGKNYYVQQTKFVGNTGFKNEKLYTDSVFPSPELRLLTLSRYWNIINYFFPYKYVIGENWDSVLVEMISKFKYADDTVAYHLAILELTVKINDSHAGFVTKYTQQYFGIKWTPFIYNIIDSKAIVTGCYNDSLCLRNDIKYGDVFLTVNGRTIEEIINEQSKYICASNQAIKMRKLYYGIFTGSTDSVTVTYEREGKTLQKTIARYNFYEFNYNWQHESKNEHYKILDGNIGYVDLGQLTKNEVDNVFEKLDDTKAIIFDVRNYPNGTMYNIAYHLLPEKKQFVMFSNPDISFPGAYRFTEPYFCGGNNKNPYKGKVVLLFNETTQSHAEFTLMALKTAPNVIGIGSQTSGADGNVSYIPLPGGYKTVMTGIGVYYPDGTETQRIGIIPDIKVKPTIEGIRAGKDEVLEKAMEVINEK